MENNILSTITKTEKKYLYVNSYNKGEIFHREGEICDSVSIVVSGEVKIASNSFSGHELIYNVLTKNEIFGNNLIFSDDPAYKGDVICLKNSVIVEIKKENLLILLQCNKDFLLMYLKIQSNFGKKLNATIKMLSESSVEERLKLFLHQNHNSIKFNTITNLANVLNMQRETLSRLLTKLEKENVIKRSPHNITLISH